MALRRDVVIDVESYDLDDAYAAADAHAAKRARIRELEASSAATRAAMAERRERRLAGEGPPEWRAPPKPAPMPVPAQPQPRKAVMDAATAKGWERWCDERIKRFLDPFKQGVAEFGAVIRKQLRAEISAAVTRLSLDLDALQNKQATEHSRLLMRLAQLEAERDGRSLSRIDRPAGAQYGHA